MNETLAESCFQTATHLTYVYTHNVCDHTAAITNHGFWDYMIYIPLSATVFAVAGIFITAMLLIIRDNFLII